MRSPRWPPHTDFPAGTLLGGKYEVVEVLGRGGNGVTYRCRNAGPGGGGDVAVKVLSLRSLRDWKQLELFEREAQILKNLDHRGIPKVGARRTRLGLLLPGARCGLRPCAGAPR